MRSIIPILLILAAPAFSAGEDAPVVLKPFRPQPESHAPAQSTHTVAAGETVYSIARKYGRDAKLILWLNRIEEGAILPVGKVLFIGEKPAAVAAR